MPERRSGGAGGSPETQRADDEKQHRHYVHYRYNDSLTVSEFRESFNAHPAASFFAFFAFFASDPGDRSRL